MLNDKILNDKIKQNIDFTLNKDHIFIKKKSLETLLQDSDIKSYLDCNVSSGYHFNKVIKCNEKGYRLIHIWEDEWNELTKQKLIDIFECKEIINFSKPLDRSWYNNLSGNFEELAPEIITKENIKIENCGYLRKID